MDVINCKREETLPGMINEEAETRTTQMEAGTTGLNRIQNKNSGEFGLIGNPNSHKLINKQQRM